MAQDFTFTADATSAQASTSTVTAAAAAHIIGGAAPATNSLLRFNTSTVADADTVTRARLAVKVSAQGTTPINVDAWAAQFGAAIAVADVNLPSNNAGIAQGNAAGYRQKIRQILATGATVGTVTNMAVPTRFVTKGGTLNSGFTDFELRPGTGFVAGATTSTTIHGSAAATPADRPTLTIRSLTEAELLDQNSDRYIAMGAESYLAFAQETTPGVPVKGKVLLDFTSSTMDSYAVNIRSASLTRQRARPRKVAPGRAGAGGDFAFELTPEKWTQILPGVGLKRTGTTGAGPYASTWKVGESHDVKTFTMVERVGGFRMVYPGCMIGSLEIDCNLDQAVTARCSVQARDEWIYDESSAGDNDEAVLSGTAGYDTVDNSILTFIGGSVIIDGVLDRGNVQRVTISINQNVQERRGLSRQRSVTGHFPLGFEVAVTFSMYFENEIMLRKFLGVEHRLAPFKAEKNVVYMATQFDFAGGAGPDQQNLSIFLPKLMFETVRKPINGEGEIMLECSGVAAYDDVTALSNVVVTTINGEPATAYDPSVDEITVQPAPNV